MLILQESLNNYIFAPFGTWVPVTESEWENFHFLTGAQRKGILSFPGTVADPNVITSVPNAVTFSNNDFTIENGYYLYAIKFIAAANSSIENHEFQIVYVKDSDNYIPVENNQYLNIYLNNMSLTTGQTYYLVLKGANLMSENNSHLNFWPTVNTIPISFDETTGNDIYTSNTSYGRYQNENVTSSSSSTGSLPAFQYFVTNEVQWAQN